MNTPGMGCWVPSALGMVCNQETLLCATIIVRPLALGLSWSLSGRVKGQGLCSSSLLGILDWVRTQWQEVILPAVHPPQPPALFLFKEVDSSMLMVPAAHFFSPNGARS